jgi:hypothetical protein
MGSSDRIHIVPLNPDDGAYTGPFEGFSGGGVVVWDSAHAAWTVVAMIVGGTRGQATMIDNGHGGIKIIPCTEVFVAIRPTFDERATSEPAN